MSLSSNIVYRGISLFTDSIWGCPAVQSYYFSGLHLYAAFSALPSTKTFGLLIWLTKVREIHGGAFSILRSSYSRLLDWRMFSLEALFSPFRYTVRVCNADPTTLFSCPE
jgi:hypothetical protein